MCLSDTALAMEGRGGRVDNFAFNNSQQHHPLQGGGLQQEAYQRCLNLIKMNPGTGNVFRLQSIFFYFL